MAQPLPIDGHLPELVERLRAAPNLVLSAEPGAGKTTRVPTALLKAGLAPRGQILVVEPRRLAARMAAGRVASEAGEAVGKTFGYQVRFEEKVGPQTRVRFITEGLLMRKLTSDPKLLDADVVVMDEFHERHLHGDTALTLLRRLQLRERPELRLLVMSATLDADPLCRFLECERLQVPGRTYPVTIEHAPRELEQHLDKRVSGALARLLRQGLDGDVLVFLPGAAEIRRARQACEAIAQREGMQLCVLHGELPAREQDAAVRPTERRKVILSTNVAESSLTIEGVSAVIDSGLARVAGHSPFSGLPTLKTAKISRASATQRAGRAGRMRAGTCVRLYTEHDFRARPAHEAPEVARSDLSEALLQTAAVDAGLDRQAWFEPPPEVAYQAARELLDWLGALDDKGALSARGRRMLRFPVHPRLAAMLVQADADGVGPEGCLFAALLGERDILLSARTRFDGSAGDVVAGPSDVLERLERFEEADAEGLSSGALRRLELDNTTARSVARVRQRLVRLIDGGHRGQGSTQDAMLRALLAGFPDRVARRRSAGSDQLVFARGSASQADTSVVRDAELLVVLDATERSGKSRSVVARLCSEVEPEWLLELYPERIEEQSELVFNGDREWVEQRLRLAYAGLTLDESRRADVESEAASACLLQALLERGPEKLWDMDALQQLQLRLQHAAAQDPSLPLLHDDALQDLYGRACEGRSSFAQLRELPLLELAMGGLPGPGRAQLQRLAPQQVSLPSGRSLQVHYEAGRPPWVQSHLQDFFGMAQGPRLGREPLVLHLLAPNRRAVQVTTDLEGFWERHYPDLRKALMRRYPRHPWPEDPLSATPPPPRRGGGQRQRR